MENIITTENLSVGYNGTPVLSGVNMTVPQVEITVILGGSGSGKTTLLKSLIGLLPPLDGSVIFSGEPVDYHSESSLDSIYRRIGVLYQGGALLNSLTLYHNVALPIKMLHSEIPEEIEREMVLSRLARVGLADAWNKFPSELSGGMKKRGALARAMVLDPEVIFCDEPSAGLDPITGAELDRLLIQLKELFQMTVVVVTHELRSIEAISDHVRVVHNGGQYFAGSRQDFLDSGDPYIRSFLLMEK